MSEQRAQLPVLQALLSLSLIPTLMNQGVVGCGSARRRRFATDEIDSFPVRLANGLPLL